MRYREKYVPDLLSMQRCCEINYTSLMRILPDVDSVGKKYQIALANKLTYRLFVLESSRYTSTIQIEQSQPVAADYLSTVMRVRLYHDVRMAEVCATQQIFNLKQRYDYPNKKMHHKDEKIQSNIFLSEWLKMCIQQGSRSVCSNC